MTIQAKGVTVHRGIISAIVCLVTLVLGVLATSSTAFGLPAVAYDQKASAHVSAMAEVEGFHKLGVTKISVQCEQVQPDGPFRIQIGYWQHGAAKTIQSKDACVIQGQEVAIMPNKGRWQVRSEKQAQMQVYTSIVRTVYRDSLKTP